MKKTVLLSVIMPCYNMADTLPRALDSILMQKTDFSYEILLIDDCSTDDTGKIARMYADKHKHIFLISHNENRGNAWSFYDGLCASKGDFFCVLDGDDYYTHREKLQRQIDFFRTDVLCDYVAIAHYYILDLGNGNLYLDVYPQHTEFTYVDFITLRSGYYHTSTYMYRNIFKNNVPEFLKEDEFRGDTPRTAFHLQESRKKVKILNFTGSAYVYTYKGIWSGMNQVKQKERQIKGLTDLKRMVDTPFEINCYDMFISNIEKNWKASDGFNEYKPVDIDYCLNQLEKYTGILAFDQTLKDYLNENFYYSEYVDSLCASLGYLNSIYYPECIQKNVNDNHIAIVIGVLNLKSNGVFHEIIELIELYNCYEIMLLVTNMADEEIPEHERVLLMFL
jgi:glycosyltransferase involved in cell wall biosynthesis